MVYYNSLNDTSKEHKINKFPTRSEYDVGFLTKTDNSIFQILKTDATLEAIGFYFSAIDLPDDIYMNKEMLSAYCMCPMKKLEKCLAELEYLNLLKRTIYRKGNRWLTQYSFYLNTNSDTNSNLIIKMIN